VKTRQPELSDFSGENSSVKTRQPELSDFSRRKPTAEKSAIAGRRKTDP
jgi:hypothetical protein